MKGYVILIASVAALGGLLFGFDTAVVAGTLDHLTAYFSLTKVQLGIVVGATSIGCIPGAWIAGKMADVYGRKKVMLLTALLYVVAALGSGLAGKYGTLVFFRLVGGLAIGLASTVAPIYISEIAPARTRGRLGMLQQLAIVTGILVSFISNYLIAKYHPVDDWRYMLGAAVVPSLVFFLLLLLVPESPRWLALMGRGDEARRIFGKLGTEPPAIEEGSGHTATLSEVFAPRYRRVTVIGLVFAAVAQLTGINIIFYYAPLIFEKSHTGGSALFQTLLTGIVNLVFTILAFWLIDRVGRKKLLLVGSAIMATCMLVLGALFWTNALDNYFVLGAIFLYIAGFACSWGAVLWVYVAEIFPNHIRGKATSVAVTGNWTANAIVSLTFPYMLDALKGGPTFLVYALLNAGMIWFVSRYIFETKGVPLEKIEETW
ncbi:sugar porter family MFS transporter [Dinghuibacter silviterrae]|uniref:SP family arabinose:H+ symporter-like MFS transporter n=1 Tax=Dinghuibacter silviterrae TaxID=1539049 RepID=A0A4R8DR09_9BACT|nr:sugar porter family MFS transporter [Dinghuibacter silviterrae]TDX00600.1 SP family arabinose:H+ symporter-like MFS transporter [Dinghuibacter silviterrae]